MTRRASRERGRHRTDAELLKELENLSRQVHETAESVREGSAVRTADTLLGRAFPLPGLDDARRLLLDQMRDGACILSTDGNVIVCNRAFGQLLGRTPEKVIGSPLAPFLRESDRPVLRALINSSTRAAHAEVSFIRNDRSERRVALLSQRTLLYGFKACCVVTRDLTEERSMADIVGSDEMSRIVFEQASEAIVVCDAEGRVLRANRRAAELAPESPDRKLIGDAYPLLSPVDGSPDRVDVLAWLENSVRAPLEARLTWRDGLALHLMLNAGPISNTAGKFLGWVITFTNVTSHVDAERELWRAAEREKQLSASLHDQAEQLREKNLELEQFALTASHDLQEPLRKISSFGDLLNESMPSMDERSKDYLARIKKAAHRMALLIDDLLQYARASKETDQLDDVDTAGVLRDVLSQLDVVIEKAGVKVEVGTLPEVRAVRGPLQQLFLNLIGNAVKYRRGPEPWVKVSAERVNGDWRFAVADNGIGIDPRYSERIFKIFERLHSRNQYLGTGIGLAICKKIVERFGGKIWVESEPEKGSTFFFTLPASRP